MECSIWYTFLKCCRFACIKIINADWSTKFVLKLRHDNENMYKLRPILNCIESILVYLVWMHAILALTSASEFWIIFSVLKAYSSMMVSIILYIEYRRFKAILLRKSCNFALTHSAEAKASCETAAIIVTPI